MTRLEQIRQRFNRAAPHYDRAGGLQREVADRLLERLTYIRIEPRRILDLGAGTLYCTHWLKRQYPKAEVVSLDIADALMAVGNRRSLFGRRALQPVCADMHALPFRAQSFDLVLSSLALQWSAPLATVIAEMARVLRADGLLLFSAFGRETLAELRAAWHRVDQQQHLLEFADLHAQGDTLYQAGFRDVVMDADFIERPVSSVPEVLRQLKAIGANYAGDQARRTLTGKRRLRAMYDAYEASRRADGLLPVTWEVVYAHAWAPAVPGAVPVQLQPGRA